MQLLRNIIWPITPIYYSATWLRNQFYDQGIFRSKSYGLPIICVGNLSTGGTGKSPMVEYLVRLLDKQFRLAILSRGFKRETSGYILADNNSTARDIGDEPFQFKGKFKKVMVAVDADRQNGISELLGMKNPPDVILLDDAFQHRKVNAGLNILLTPYHNLYVNDSLLPSGNLREPKSGAKRADIVIVTKCPENLSDEVKRITEEKLKLEKNQLLFFSKIRYSNNIINGSGRFQLEHLKGKNFTLVTGIANADPLIHFLKQKNLSFKHSEFKDHHKFSDTEIREIEKKELVLTTEKDYGRLKPYLKNKSIFYLPIEFIIDRNEIFDRTVKEFCNSY